MQPNQESQQPNMHPEVADPALQHPELWQSAEAPAAPAAPDAASQPGQGAPTGPLPVAPQLPQAPPPPVPGSQVTNNPLDGPRVVPAAPQVAGDVDVIEKEWVDQADKIVKQTAGDPYLEEEAVESLQMDYLKKRYGHDVRKPGDKDDA